MVKCEVAPNGGGAAGTLPPKLVIDTACALAYPSALGMTASGCQGLLGGLIASGQLGADYWAANPAPD